METPKEAKAVSLGQQYAEMRSLASSMGVICSCMTGFYDSGLFMQMISLCGPDPVRIANESMEVECVDVYLAHHLAAWVKVALANFGRDHRTWDDLYDFMDSSVRRESALVRMSYRAMMLDRFVCKCGRIQRIADQH